MKTFYPSMMRALTPLAFLFAFGLAIPSPAAKVLKVSEDGNTIMVDPEGGTPLVEGDMACVFHEDQEVGCGPVVKSTPRGAVLQLESQKERILAGDDVKSSHSGEEETLPPEEAPAPEAKEESASAPLPEEANGEASMRPPSAPMDRVELVKYHRDIIHSYSSIPGEEMNSPSGTLKRRFDITVGSNLYGESGGGNVWPTAQFQVALSHNYSFSLTGSYFGLDVMGFTSITTSVSLGVSYYATELYKGVFGNVSGGLGFSTLSAGDNTAPATVYTLKGTLGYRWLLGAGFNIGIQGGLEMVGFPVTAGVLPTAASPILPMVLVDLGFGF